MATQPWKDGSGVFSLPAYRAAIASMLQRDSCSALRASWLQSPAARAEGYQSEGGRVRNQLIDALKQGGVLRIPLPGPGPRITTAPSPTSTVPRMPELAVELLDWLPDRDAYYVRFTYEGCAATVAVDALKLRHGHIGDLVHLADEALNATSE